LSYAAFSILPSLVDFITIPSLSPAFDDPKQFGAATLKPSGKYPGVRIEGDSADFGGACTGFEYGNMTGFRPSDLGEIKLKRTANGWFIYEVDLPNTTCGG